jgi:hypothetical protein
MSETKTIRIPGISVAPLVARCDQRNQGGCMNQFDMFPPPPEAQKQSPRYGIPRSVALMWERASSPAVAASVLEVCAARKGEWLGWNHFRAVIEKYQISSCFGHVLSRMAREGLIGEQTIYHGKGIGAEKPGSPNYQGFGSKYSDLSISEIREAV